MRTYRLDKFVVPNSARQEFLSKVKEIHAVLRRQPGFKQDLLLEQPQNEEAFNLVTLIEWEDVKYVAGAREVVMALHKSTGFEPKETMSRLGIKAEMGTYKSINA